MYANKSIKPLRILLVEEEPTLGGLLCETLAQMGHVVCPIVGCHAAALEVAASLQPEVLIVGVDSSDPGEFAAIEDGRSTPPLPHVFISVIARSAETFRPGVAALRMPFGVEKLSRAIEHVVELKAPE